MNRHMVYFNHMQYPVRQFFNLECFLLPDLLQCVGSSFYKYPIMYTPILAPYIDVGCGTGRGTSIYSY
jgi:hypothetical protein